MDEFLHRVPKIIFEFLTDIEKMMTCYKSGSNRLAACLNKILHTDWTYVPDQHRLFPELPGETKSRREGINQFCLDFSMGVWVKMIFLWRRKPMNMFAGKGLWNKVTITQQARKRFILLGHVFLLSYPLVSKQSCSKTTAG